MTATVFTKVWKSIAMAIALLFLYTPYVYAIEVPFFSDLFPSIQPHVQIDTAYGYRQSPDYYNVNLEEVVIRLIVTNPSDVSLQEQLEMRIYRVTELWDTLGHDLSYDERFSTAIGLANDEERLFTSSELFAIDESMLHCQPANGVTCFHEEDPDTGKPYAGIILYEKPEYVAVGNTLALEPVGQSDTMFDWIPRSCGYFRFEVRPYGYQPEQNVIDSHVEYGFIRVSGCDEGDVRVNGVSTVNPNASMSETPENLPYTATGSFDSFKAVLGMMVGGVLMSIGIHRELHRLGN